MSEGILSFIGTWFCILEVMWLVKKITGGLSAAIRIEPSGSKPWQGTMSCAFGQDTLFSQCLSHELG